MYYVNNKQFDHMSDAMRYCSSGSPTDVVTNEFGTILMKHEQVPIGDIIEQELGLALLKHNNIKPDKILEMMMIQNILGGQS